MTIDAQAAEARREIYRCGWSWRSLRAHLADRAMSSALPMSLLAKFIVDEKLGGDAYLRSYIADRLAEAF